MITLFQKKEAEEEEEEEEETKNKKYLNSPQYSAEKATIKQELPR